MSKNEKLISDEVSDELRELCIDQLQTNGFDIDDNPTEKGKKLEELIDTLFTD